VLADGNHVIRAKPKSLQHSLPIQARRFATAVIEAEGGEEEEGKGSQLGLVP